MSAGWSWAALLLLGAYHGINPGMGWLFSVALGMQEKSSRAVVRSLWPIALGHAAAIAVMLALAGVVQIVLPLRYVKIGVAAALVALGGYRILRSRHFQWGGMQAGFRDLAIWSFLMASAHGAGLMVLPVVLGASAASSPHQHHLPNQAAAVWATLVHTLGYLVVTAAIALVVYRKLGLSLLRRAWFNLDLLWAVALIVTGMTAVMM